MSLPRRSQSALEYMMTYGWAILVIVIVAAVLYSLGIFSPSSSLSTTITGFSNLGTVNAVCLGGTSFTISMGDSIGYPINITQINLTSSSGKTTYSPNILIQPNAIQTVTVPSSSLCTSGARYSVSAVISYLEPGQLLPGPYTSTGTVTGTAASPPSSATSYEPLTIANTQNRGTPSPFQQMINVTSSSPGWADISSSPFGQNVEFFSSTGQILDSWLENYTSTHAIWWVKLTSSIPAGSRQTIYMGFASTSTNLFNTVNDGEGPQLSGTGPLVLPPDILYSIPYAIVYGYGTEYNPFTFNLTIDPALLSQYEASNLSNIEAFAANGTELQARLQGTPTSSSTSAVISITFPGGMNYFTQLRANAPDGSNSYNLFYLGFASPSTDLHALYDNNIPYSPYPAITFGGGPLEKNIGYWGEYDDGASVFNNYTNFSGGKISFGNAWSFGLPAQGFGFFTGLYYSLGNRMGYSIMPINYGEIGQSYTTLNNWDFTASPAYITNITYTSLYGPFNLVPGQCCALPSNQGEAIDLGWGTNGSGLEPMANLNSSGEYIFEQNQSAFTKINSSIYGIAPINSSYEEFLLGNKIIGTMRIPITGKINFGLSTVYLGQNLYSYWMLVRAVPPNGVMPSVGFGSVS